MLFATSQFVHLTAIIAAMILMFHPAANAYIRATRRRAKRNRVQIKTAVPNGTPVRRT